MRKESLDFLVIAVPLPVWLSREPEPDLDEWDPIPMQLLLEPMFQFSQLIHYYFCFCFCFSFHFTPTTRTREEGREKKKRKKLDDGMERTEKEWEAESTDSWIQNGCVSASSGGSPIRLKVETQTKARLDSIFYFFLFFIIIIMEQCLMALIYLVASINNKSDPWSCDQRVFSLR